MILERREQKDTETSEIFVECYYDSSSIIKSIYLPERKTLYVIFKRGVLYSYINVDLELYLGFENADSQGVYFSKNIAKNPDCQYFREYKLYEFEKMDIFRLIEEKKGNIGDNKNT